MDCLGLQAVVARGSGKSHSLHSFHKDHQHMQVPLGQQRFGQLAARSPLSLAGPLVADVSPAVIYIFGEVVPQLSERDKHTSWSESQGHPIVCQACRRRPHPDILARIILAGFLVKCPKSASTDRSNS